MLGRVLFPSPGSGRDRSVEKCDLFNMYSAGDGTGDSYFGKVVCCLRLAICLVGGRMHDLLWESTQEGLHRSVVDRACNLFRELLDDQMARAGPWTGHQLKQLLSAGAFHDQLVDGGFCFCLYVQVCSPVMENSREAVDAFSQTLRAMRNCRKDDSSDRLVLLGTHEWVMSLLQIWR